MARADRSMDFSLSSFFICQLSQDFTAAGISVTFYSFCFLRCFRINNFKDRKACVCVCVCVCVCMCMYVYTVTLYMAVLTWVSHVYKPNIVNIAKSGNSKAKDNNMGHSFCCLNRSLSSILCKCVSRHTPFPHQKLSLSTCNSFAYKWTPGGWGRRVGEVGHHIFALKTVPEN